MSESEQTDQRADNVWYESAKSIKQGLEASVELAAIGAVTYMAVNGVPSNSMNVAAGVIGAVAVGKRYLKYKREQPSQ